MHIPSKKYIGARHKIMVETEKRGDVRIRKGRKGLERGEGEKKKKKYGETLPPTVIFVSAETVCHARHNNKSSSVRNQRSGGEEIFE